MRESSSTSIGFLVTPLTGDAAHMLRLVWGVGLRTQLVALGLLVQELLIARWCDWIRLVHRLILSDA